MFATRDLLHMPVGVTFEQRNSVIRLLDKLQPRQVAQEAMLPTSREDTEQTATSPDVLSRAETPEIARTCQSPPPPQILLSPIGNCSYGVEQEDLDEAGNENYVNSAYKNASMISSYPSDEDITEAFASIVLEEEELEEGEGDTSSRHSGVTSSILTAQSNKTVGSRSHKMPAYGTLILQKKPTVRAAATATAAATASSSSSSRRQGTLLPPTPPSSPDDDSAHNAGEGKTGLGRSHSKNNIHPGSLAWLQKQHRIFLASILVVSPRTRQRVVFTVASDLAARLEHDRPSEPLLLPLRSETPAQGRRKDGGKPPKAKGTTSSGGQGALIVTSNRAAVEEWCELLRLYSHIRLLAYTDSLAKRRQMGAHRLRSHDVIVTTMDILKAQETGISENLLRSVSAAKGSGGEEEYGEDPPSFLNGGATDEKSDWLMRGPEDEVFIEASFLHLFHFRHAVLDYHEAPTVRASTKKGEALRRVCADSKTSLLQASGGIGEIYSQASTRNARDAMGIGSVPVASITLNCT